MSERGFIAAGTTGLSVTSTTGRVALTTSVAGVCLLQNLGATACYFKLGDVTVTATTSDTPLGPGAAIVMDQSTYTYVAAICGGSDSTTLKATSGAGNCEIANAATVAISGVTVTTDTQGTATAAAPSYSEGTSNDLSMNLAGAMRVVAESGTIKSGSIASGAVASGAIASGAYASGAIGSGAIASGAVASGAVASGAYASGSLASGAMVDLVALSTPITPATATATKSVLLGTQYNSTQATFTNGQQGSVQATARGAVIVAPGAEGFTLSALAAGTNLIGQVSASDETATIYSGTTALTPKFAKIATSSSGASEVVALVSAKKIRVLAMQLVANAAVNVKWQSHVTPTDLTGLAYLAANGGYVLPYNPVGWFQSIAGEALDINLSGAVAVGGSLTYIEV